MSTKEVRFISPYRKFMTKANGKLIRFEQQDMISVFSTSDEELIAALKAKPGYGKDFGENIKLKNINTPNVVVGIRTATNAEESELEKEQVKEDLLRKFKKFNELKEELIKKDGSPRADADPELLKEFDNLKSELKL